MLSTSAIKCRGDFKVFEFASAMRWQKTKLPKTQQKTLHITSATAWACIGILTRAMIWFFNSWDYLIYLNYIVFNITHSNGWNRRHLVLVSLRRCFSKTTYYPTLEKPSAQNKAVSEKQSKQRELSDHWKSMKTFLLKKARGDAKKTKKLTGILVLTKDWFYILQNQIYV